MKLDIEPGEYHLIAWAGLYNQSFAVPVLYPQTSQITELKVKTLPEECVRTRSEFEKEKSMRHINFLDFQILKRRKVKIEKTADTT